MPSHNDLRDAIDQEFDATVATLKDLVSIPSISASQDAAPDVRRSAEAVLDLLSKDGFSNVQILEIDGAHPAVFGEIPAPEGSPTVLLYAHHDVQPVGPGWTTSPFEPEETDGRLTGRGSADDKAGVVMHLAAVKAHGGTPPVGVKIFIEGEEEIGSTHLTDFLDAYGDLLSADAIVIGDSGNWRVGVPALTTSLRGLVDCDVEVRVLEAGVHSGMFGGVFPDALMVLSRVLSSLHDDEGNVAIPGLVSSDAPALDLTEEEVRSDAGAVEGLEIVGTGSLTSKTWSRPACSILAIDAPPISDAINALVPAASAKVSLRLAPGDDPAAAMEAMAAHLESNVPWGAKVTVTKGSSGDPYRLDTTGPAYDAYRAAFAEAWQREPVEMGVGGSIPFVAAFSERYPDAAILLTGVADPTSSIHGPNESVSLDDLRKACLAEAIALRLLAGHR